MRRFLRPALAPASTATFSATTPYQQQSRRPHESDILPIVSDGVGPQLELPCYHVLPTFSMPLDAPRSSERADRAASRP